MAQKFVEQYANTLITISSSDDDDDAASKIIVRRTPSLEDIAELLKMQTTKEKPCLEVVTIPDTPDRKDNNEGLERTPSDKLPMASIVNSAFVKLGLHEKNPTRMSKRIHAPKNRRHPYKKIDNSSTDESSRYTAPPQYKNIQNLFKKPEGITIAIEGNIGIGKTTFMRKLKAITKAHVTSIREPLEQWSRNNHINLLAKMYSNPRKWAFIFQSVVLANLLQNHVYTAKNKIMERSLSGALQVFLRAHHDNGTLKHSESIALQHWCEIATELHPTVPDLIIYIRAPPRVALSRIRIRGRKEEKSIKMKYVAQLHSLYDEWLLKRNIETKVIVLSANQTSEDMLDDLNEQLDDF